jgi:hypothetical protein
VRSTHHGKPTPHLPAPNVLSTTAAPAKPIHQPTHHQTNQPAPTNAMLRHPYHHQALQHPSTHKASPHQTSTHLVAKGEGGPAHQEGEGVACGRGTRVKR